MSPTPQQPIKLGFDDLIAFAACRFQSLTVEDSDVAADVTNQTGLLQAFPTENSIWPQKGC